MNNDNQIEIIKGEAFSLDLEFESDSEDEVFADYRLSVRLLSNRGRVAWTIAEPGSGIQRTSSGWFINLLTAQTDQPVGDYLLVTELKSISTAMPVQSTTPVRITSDLI